MFIASFRLKTSIQRWLVTLQDFIDFPKLHPAREAKLIALRESVLYAKHYMGDAVGMESAREVLAAALQSVIVQGHYLEFGVYKGGTIRFIARVTGPSKSIHGFDSFEGLDEPWTGDSFRFDAGGRLPKVPKNVALHKGRFSATLPGWLSEHPGPVAFAHIDSDLYHSAKTVFQHIGDRIVPGTVLVFDEYFNYPGWREHEFRAWREFVEHRHIRYEYLAYARFQVAVRVLNGLDQSSAENATDKTL